MGRLSNVIVTMINLLTLGLSLCAIALSAWFYIKVETPCERTLRMPLLMTGGALLVVSMMALLGACCRVSFFMWLYLITLFLVIVAMIVFSAFSIIVTNKGIGQTMSEAGIETSKLGDFSFWLQNSVSDPQNWEKVKSCMIQARMCQSIATGMPEEFYKQNLPPVQSGCCKPPNYCELKFKNATNWEMPEAGPAMPDPDCKTWSNDQTKLCYSCESCKAAVLQNLKREWRIVSFANTFVLILITIVYSIGCCALRNNQKIHRYSKFRGY